MKRYVYCVAFTLTLLALTFACGRALALGGGHILPPTAMPHGYSLADLAQASAFFDTSGNTAAYYPDTPFQILFVDRSTQTFTSEPDGGVLNTGSNHFTVRPGTPFYVPIAFVDDSPPIIGTFPADTNTAASYFFGASQVGFTDGAIRVDGKTTTDLQPYLVGPLQTPPLPDGGGTHILVLGVFLTPMSVGTHTVTIQGNFAGAAIQPATGITYLKFMFTYTVTVKPQAH